MRITFVLPHADLSGGIRVVAVHARLLRRRGHEVLVVSTPRKLPPWRTRLRALLEGRGWRAWRGGPSHLDGAEVPHRVLDRARPICDADVPDADAVIATWWETAEWVAALSPRKGAKVYFLQHHEIHEGQPVERVKATWRLPLHKIVISRWLGRISAEDYGDSSFSLVPNSVDTELFRADPRGKQARPCVGFVYSRLGWKGADIALAAVQAARRALPDLALVSFGADLPAAPLPAGARFHHRPPQAALASIYSACDAWLYASRAEGFGLPLLEAMACRTPVVATPAGAAPELLEGGGGALVPHADPEAMAGALLDIVRLPEPRWRALSDAAWATASGYTWEDAADRFEAALRAAVERGAPGKTR